MEHVRFGIIASHQGSERQQMQVAEDVGIMVRLHAQGWGSRRIARELGVSRNTVKRYVRAGGYLPYGGPAAERRVWTAWIAGWQRTCSSIVETPTCCARSSRRRRTSV